MRNEVGKKHSPVYNFASGQRLSKDRSLVTVNKLIAGNMTLGTSVASHHLLLLVRWRSRLG